MGKLVAIHQPNFFPWLGYFDKIARSDVFILLDHVQFQKTGGTWCNRVKLLLAGEARWVTAPMLRRFHGVQAICDVEFQPDNPWRDKILKSLVTNYGKAPFFREIVDFLEPLLASPVDNLARYNGANIMAVSRLLGLSADKFRWSSEMAGDEHSNDMLISLTRAVGGDAYMCGGGASGYQDDATFAAAGVRLIYQNFKHPVYAQIGSEEFSPGLSVIDALMNIGVAGVRTVLHAAKDQ